MKNKVYIVALIGIVFDQITKIIIKSNLRLYENITIIPKFFSLRYVENTGAAFSILESGTYLLIIISFLVLFYLIYYLNKEKNNLDNITILTLGMIMSGIVGNLIDRVLYNKVVDFLSFNIFGYHFPVFNVADSLIVIGVIILIGNYIYLEYKKGRKDGSRRKRCKEKA